MILVLVGAEKNLNIAMDNKNSEIKQDFKCGYVAIVGEPNVGKSTLMNTLIGQKISIVTNKAQTTRHKIIGILSTENFQIIFLDTPGLLKPKYLLHNYMMNAANAAIDDADLILFMIDAKQPKLSDQIENDIAFQKIKNANKPTFLIINKVDLVNKLSLLPIIDFYSRKFPFIEIFTISALNELGTIDLLKSIVKILPVNPPYYPDDTVSDANERFFVSEIIREKIFQNYKQEIPYSTTVNIIEFRESNGKKDFISAEIYVEKPTQKAILIGKKGDALKKIGEAARKEIENFLGRSVFLELHVKVREKWRESDNWLMRLGYKTH